jgi:hypothetical protein
VLEKLLARAFDPQVRVGRDTGAKLLQQARLADPRLAEDEHDLPLALAHALPAAQQ